MGLIKGGFLRLFQTFLYALAFCCAGIILGVYSYFLSVLADRDYPISQWKKAVEGLSGAATLYLIFAVILTCCLGGISFFAFVAIVLDICFCGALIAIAVMTRHGVSSCSGTVNTPLGTGLADSSTGGFGNGGFGEHDGGNLTYSVKLGTACKLNKAAFAVAVVGAVLFLITALMQIALVRSHKKEKRYGPSPANNYTSGYGSRRGLFGRKKRSAAAADKDAELGSTGPAAGGVGQLATPGPDTRPSHETAYTGSTVAGAGSTGPYDKYDKVDGAHNGHLPHGSHGGYYTQPQGTGVNPYGYEANAAPNTYTTGTATNY